MSINVDEPGNYKCLIETNTGCSSEEIITIGDAENPDDILSFFRDKGFYELPLDGIDVELRETRRILPDDDPVLCELDMDVSAETPIINDSGVENILLRDESPINLVEIIKSNLTYFADEYGFRTETGKQDAFAYITDNENVCFCEDYLKEVEAKFNDRTLAYWVHIYKDADVPGSEKMLILSNNKNSEGVVLNFPGIGVQAELRKSVIDKEIYPIQMPSSNFTSIAEEMTFCAMNTLADIHPFLKTSNELDPNDIPTLCNNVAFNSTEEIHYFGLTPTCCLFSLPESFVPVFNQDLLPGNPTAALYGYTDLTEINSDMSINPKYYWGIIKDDFFTGYYEFNKKGTQVRDFPENVAFPMRFPNPAVVTGELFETGDGNEIMNITTYPFKESSLNSEGEFVIPSLDETWDCTGNITLFNDSLENCQDDVDWADPIDPTISIQTPIPNWPFVPLPLNVNNLTFDEIVPSLPPLVNYNGTLSSMEIDGESKMIATLELTDGSNVHAVWNCYLKTWEAFEPDECLQSQLNTNLEEDITGDPLANNRFSQGVSNAMVQEFFTAMGISNLCCFDNNLEQNYNINLPVVNGAGFQEDFIQKIQQEIDRVALTSSGLRVQYVLTHEAVNGNCSQVAIDFENQILNQDTDPDIIVKMHFTNDGNAEFTSRFNDNFFNFKDNQQNNISETMSQEVLHLAKNAVKDGMQLSLSKLKKDLPALNIPEGHDPNNFVEEFDQKFDQSDQDTGGEYEEDDADDGKDPETAHRFDVKLIGGNFIELKSLNKKSGIAGIPSSPSFQANGQFGKYLANITDISQLRYTFNKRKLVLDPFESSVPNSENYYANKEAAELAIKNKFKRLMGADLPTTPSKLAKANHYLQTMNDNLVRDIFDLDEEDDIDFITPEMLIVKLNEDLPNSFLNVIINVE